MDRARMMQRAPQDIKTRIKERIDTPTRQAFAFEITGRHLGALATPIAEIPATDAEVRIYGMVIFVIDVTGRVTAVWAIADYLPLLAEAAACRLSPSSLKPSD